MMDMGLQPILDYYGQVSAKTLSDIKDVRKVGLTILKALRLNR